MPLRHLPILLICTLGLAACVTAKDRYREDGYRFLTGAETEELVSGNTVEGRYINRVGLWSDYHLADGRVASREGDGVHYGTWEIQGDQICYTYPDEHPDSPTPLPNCIEVAEKDGSYVHFLSNGPRTGELGGQWIGVLPGNAKDLPLE